MATVIKLGQKLRPARPSALRGPDWMQANPQSIQAALECAIALPSGGWYAVDASRKIGAAPRSYTVAGRELVAWRDESGLHFGPEACPHMGAPLSCGRVERGRLVCPWHGLALGPRGHGGWRPFPAYDDGVLAWVRLARDEAVTDAPILAPRPERYVQAVMRMEARCEPSDVLANRLDPWHGSHYHPHSFARLQVLDLSDERLACRVAVRLAGPLSLEVDCTFHCPDPRTVVMTITDGEGAGSVVETHATPVRSGRTVILEATLATSERRGFALARRGAGLLRPAIEWAQRRLWREDAAYAERRYELRQRGFQDKSLGPARSRQPVYLRRRSPTPTPIARRHPKEIS